MESLYGTLLVRCVSLGCVLLVLCEGGTDGRSEGMRYSAENGAALPPDQSVLQCPGCRLSLFDPDMAASVAKLASAERIHLIRYELKFPEYGEKIPPRRERDNETTHNNNNNNDDNYYYYYRTNVWYRVFSPHGLRLITTAFNFDALSLGLLGYGAEALAVPVVDGPPQCFRALTDPDRMASMLCLLFDDLEGAAAGGSTPWDAERDSVCHQVVESDGGRATLAFRCCTRVPSSASPSSPSSSPGGRRIKCGTAERDAVVDALFVLLAGLKVAFVLFSPIVLQRVLFEGSTKKTSYVVPVLEEHGLSKTMLVKKVRSVDDETTTSGRRKDMKQFTRFRRLLKTIPSEAIVPVRFNRLDILVDHKDLMTEDDVPVGLFRFLYDTFIRCGITRVEPLRSCCQESVFGSWSPRFLWIRLRKRCDCNRSCRDSCSWSSIFQFLGVLVLILLVPLPYYVRVTAFYLFERDEVKERRAALDRLGLDPAVDHNALQWLTPTHAGFVALYVVYLVSLLLLSALRVCDPAKIDGVARACVTDMRNVRRWECLRMICAHVLLPFEKFGIFGVLVAAVYWPVALSVCLAVTVFYCVPLVYLTGRLLVNFRPGCCRRKPIPTAVGARSARSISGGVTSFDSCFFLDSISPDSRPYSTTTTESGGSAPESGKKPKQRNMIVYRQKLASAFGDFLVGVLMLLAVYSVLVMYAETFGFLVEVAVLTALGAIVNSDRAVQYVILGVWGLVYVTASCHLSYSGYARLSRRLFAFVKARLGGAVQEASSLRQDRRRNTAFKFFTSTEAAELRIRDSTCLFQDDDDGDNDPVNPGIVMNPSRRDEVDCNRWMGTEDSIEYRDNRLHWIVNTLVLFIDKNDVSRIPVDFFWDVCRLDMPGSPGPVHRAALRAFGRILASVLFLSLLSIVVLSFGNMYEVTTTIQMMLMLVSGGIPLIVYLAVYGCNRPERSCINEYSLRGKVQRVILGFCQSWPVYDLSFVQGPVAAAAATSSSMPASESARRYPEQNHHLRSHLAGGKQCDTCGHLLDGCSSSAADRLDGGWRTPHHGPGSRTEDGPLTNRCVDPMQVDLLITVRDEQEDDENIRSEPISLGSGMSINSNGRTDRISPDENQGGGPNVYSAAGQSQGAVVGGGGCVTNQPTNATRTRMTESAEALQNDVSGPLQPQQQQQLRKQSSASTLPVQNHVTAVTTTATTTADMVVDVSDDIVCVKRFGFASSPRNTVSMRSLPSYKHRSSESTSESAL